MKRQYEVKGMTCGGCARSLVAAVRGAGIELDAAGVSVEGGTIEVDGNQDEQILRQAVETAGFELGKRLP